MNSPPVSTSRDSAIIAPSSLFTQAIHSKHYAREFWAPIARALVKPPRVKRRPVRHSPEIFRTSGRYGFPHRAGARQGTLLPKRESMSLGTPEFTNAIGLWAFGLITLEILTQPSISGVLGSSSPSAPAPSTKGYYALKNHSKSGIEFVERALTYPQEHRITAGEALDSWPASPERPAPLGVRPWVGIRHRETVT